MKMMPRATGAGEKPASLGGWHGHVAVTWRPFALLVHYCLTLRNVISCRGKMSTMRNEAHECRIVSSKLVMSASPATSSIIIETYGGVTKVAWPRRWPARASYTIFKDARAGALLAGGGGRWASQSLEMGVGFAQPRGTAPFRGGGFERRRRDAARAGISAYSVLPISSTTH